MIIKNEILPTTSFKFEYTVIILYFQDTNFNSLFTLYLIRTSAFNSYQDFKQEILYDICIYIRILTAVVVILVTGQFYLRIRNVTQLGRHHYHADKTQYQSTAFK